jgi:predicted signal transduction protein with EAL and GGDEF domain
MLKDFISFLGWQRRWLLVMVGLVALTLIGIGDWFAGGSLLEFSVFFSPVHAINRPVAYWNGLIWLEFFSLLTFLIADLKALHMRERELARVDHLTRVATRVALYEFAGEISGARRSNSPMTLVYLDLDSFKEINDRQGHATGDRVPVTVARKCGKVCAYRPGGADGR